MKNLLLLTWLPRLFQKAKNNNNKKRTRPNDDSDSDSDNEPFLAKDNWPRFIVVKSSSEEQPLSKLPPYAVQKGFRQ